MLAVQPIHWGKIRIGKKDTWPPPELGRILVHTVRGHVFISTGHDDLAWYCNQMQFMACDGDVWQEIPKPPENLLTRR